MIGLTANASTFTLWIFCSTLSSCVVLLLKAHVFLLVDFAWKHKHFLGSTIISTYVCSMQKIQKQTSTVFAVLIQDIELTKPPVLFCVHVCYFKVPRDWCLVDLLIPVKRSQETPIHRCSIYIYQLNISYSNSIEQWLNNSSVNHQPLTSLTNN